MSALALLQEASAARRPARRAAHPGRWLLLAYFTIVVGYLLAPILIIVPLSFSDQSFMQFPPRVWSLRWYDAFWTSPAWVEATWRSFRVATAASVLSVAAGGLAAFALDRGRVRARGALTAVFAGPAMVPHVVIALGVFILAIRIGQNDSELFLTLAHAALALPFSVLIIGGALRQIDPTLERAARILGAGPVRAFRTATLPILAPALVASGIFSFFISFDELVVALFVMGEHQTLPMRLWSDLRFELNPTIAAVSTILVVATTVALGAAETLRRLAARLAAEAG